ncbi:RING finger protein 38 [Plakobranchus ocellatus]|uniref:RING finger protein 38 n=1 Tax=Plakobranchus ocellatus TaxID=259542 RepID=A0AAV4BQF1_9GAST|nr:RING finger protein 38 [Plakobranchus ocellatus]
MTTRHIIAAAQHIGAAIQHNYSTTHHIAAVIQNNAVSTRLSDNFQFTSDEDFNDTDSEIGQMLDDHSSPDNGLSEDKIQEIPTLQFSRSADRSGSDQTSCVFCICDFEDKQLLRILPRFHEFHAESVDEWLKVRLSSPSLSSSVPRCNQNRNYSRAEMCLVRKF